MIALKYVVLLVFPTTFLLTIPLHFKFHGRDPPSFEMALNNIFAVYGYNWFTVLYGLILGNRIYFRYRNKAMDRRAVIACFRGAAVKYLINTIVFIFILCWFFGDGLFNKVNAATGGHCHLSTNNSNIGYVECAGLEGDWINGFDSSGHFYLTISISLMTIYELIELDYFRPHEIPKYVSLEEGAFFDAQDTYDRNEIRCSRYVTSMSMILLAVWYIIFLTTCIFYHTLMEKVIGLLMGVVVPAALYVR